jgi:hypothetical protein
MPLPDLESTLEPIEPPAAPLPASVALPEATGLTAQLIIQRLRDESLPLLDRRKTIAIAEVHAVDASESAELKPLLRTYVERFRDSKDPADLVAVGSAVRKYVALLDEDEIASIGFLLEAGHRAAVSPEIELEVAKMVLRKLSATLPEQADPYPELGERLMELARTYLNARLLPRPHLGATALNSVLGLVLLRSRYLAEVYGILSKLRLEWFKQQLARRAGKLFDDLSVRFPAERSQPHREQLASLQDALETPG